MAFRFHSKETVSDGIRRIVHEEIDGALADLSPDSPDRNKGVHEARKRFKKIRSVVRLARGALRRRDRRRENSWFRDTGRTLSAARDAGAMVETMEKLRDRFPDRFGTGRYAPIHDAFVQRRDSLTASGPEFERLVDEVSTGLREAKDRVSAWTMDPSGFDVIEKGLVSVYRGGRKAFRNAYSKPCPENFHEFRKRVKDHWYHVRLLHGIWPEVMEGLRDSLKRLSEYLGDDHDLVVFRDALPEVGSVARDEDVTTLLAGVDERQGELQESARLVATRVYSEKPKAFLERVKGYWTAWHAD